MLFEIQTQNRRPNSINRKPHCNLQNSNQNSCFSWVSLVRLWTTSLMQWIADWEIPTGLKLPSFPGCKSCRGNGQFLLWNMPVPFIILDWIFVFINTTTTISCKHFIEGIGHFHCLSSRRSENGWQWLVSRRNLKMLGANLGQFSNPPSHLFYSNISLFFLIL